MRDKHNKNNTLCFEQKPLVAKPGVSVCLVRAVCAALLMLGFCGCVFSATSSTPISLLAPLGIMLALCVGLCLAPLFPGGQWLAPGVAVLSTLISLLFFSTVQDGMRGWVNAFSDTVIRTTGRTVLKLAWSGSTAASTLAVTLVLIALALLFSALVASGKVWLVLIPLVLLSGAYTADILRSATYLVVFGLGACLLFLLGARKGHNAQTDWRGLCFSLILTLLLCLLPSTTALLLFRSPPESAFGRNLHSLLHELHFDSPANSLPEGELSELGAWRPTEETALELRMSEPQKLYLRGFVGENYTSTAWERAKGDTLLNASDRFYWLHQGGFYAQAQIGLAGNAAGKKDNPPATLEIRNISACKKRLFLPYALADTTLLDPMLIGDGWAAAEGEVYTLSYFPGSVPQWYEIQAELAAGQDIGKKATLAYLDAEEAYSEYVFANYLQLTDDAIGRFNQILGSEPASMTITQIKTKIQSFLEENLHYSTSAVTGSGKADFADYLLSHGGSGYSVHYATIATLLLRYYGVPARYVEGYYLSADEAAYCKADEPIALSESHAHAWTEYYLDGVGWMPFEVTPPYIDDEEIVLQEFLEDPNSEFVQRVSGLYRQDHSAVQAKTPPLTPPDEPEPEKESHSHFQFKGIYVIVLLLFLLLAFAVVTLVRRRKLWRRLEHMYRQSDNSIAVAQMFGYAVLLMSTAGLKRETEDAKVLYLAIERWLGMDSCWEACLLHDRALFAKQELTIEERGKIKLFLRRTQALCLRRWSFWERIKYRVVKIII